MQWKLTAMVAGVLLCAGLGGCPTDALPEDVVPPGDRIEDDVLDPIGEPDNSAGDPSAPGDDPGSDPGDDPGGDPGDDPGGDPGDGPGDDPGPDPGDGPGDDPNEPQQPGGDDPGDDPDDPPGGGGPAPYIGQTYSGGIVFDTEYFIEQIPNSTSAADLNDTLTLPFASSGRIEVLPVPGYFSPYAPQSYTFDVPVGANVGDTETLQETYVFGARQYQVTLDATVTEATYTSSGATIALDITFTGVEGSRTDEGTGTHVIEITVTDTGVSVSSTTEYSVVASGSFTFVETTLVDADLAPQ